MTRIKISREELRSFLTSKIQSVDGCEECSFGGVMPLAEPDESGCNWSDSIVLSNAGVPAEIYIPVVQKLMLEIRSKYNIK